VKDFGAGLLQDIESSALDLPDLIIAENTKEYRPVFAKGRLDHITSLGVALLLCKYRIIGKSAVKARRIKGRRDFWSTFSQSRVYSDCLCS
jgi:hypothetical protein